MQHLNNQHSSMHNPFKVKSFILFALLTIFSLPAASQPFGSGGHPPKINLDRMANRLDLNEQQRTDIKAIMASGKITMQPTVAAMQTNREALEKIINGNNPDQNQIQSLAKAQGDLFTKNFLQKASLQLQVNEILSEEQRMKMQAYKAARRDMRTARKQRQPQHRSR